MGKTTTIASELRIGNFVTINNPNSWPRMKDVPAIVSGYRSMTCQMFPESAGAISLIYDNYEYSQFAEFISPIPLTYEWLVKFGFRNESVLNGSDQEVEDFWFRPACGFVIKENDNFYYELKYRKVEFEYVHQLQNLYFALTGEEL